tara:strand:+ start:410 stop:814 length:405 start_codon:yes stop_codon:yes gene_type:complete
MSNPLALDPCPDCGEIDQCYTAACICPVCKDDPRALPAWTALAPIMRKLDGGGLVWNWGTDSIILDGPARHFLEINGRDIWYEIHLKDYSTFIVEKIFISNAFEGEPQTDSKIVYQGSSAVLAAVSVDFEPESC